MKYTYILPCILTIFPLHEYFIFLNANDEYSETFPTQGKLIAVTFDDITVFSRKFHYTKLVKFRAHHAVQKILLREYFLLLPGMHINVDGMTLRDNELDGMPKYYYGIGKPNKNQTFLGRLYDRYFNGTFYHGRQISYFNCLHDKKISKVGDRRSKYICEVFQDEDIENKMKALRSKAQPCATENPIHIRMQETVTIASRKFMHVHHERRKKRKVNAVTCVLHLMADHTFYKHIGGENIPNAVGEMVTSVMEADVIFRGTDFNGDGKGDNIGFAIGNITIYTRFDDPRNKFQDESISVYTYLNRMTEYDFSSYCLGIGFTHRDFAKGIVGLAWVASSSKYGAVGGICQGKVGFGTGLFKSYNTAVVTYLNSGTRIPSQKSALTLVHELGHSFGSPHDDSSNLECSPGGIYGSYIMDPYSNSGEKPNHRKFSACSINSMYPVVVRKGSCFKTYSGPMCGNNVIEGNEECDCGTSGTCPLNDVCCTPSDVPHTDPDKGCTVRRSQGKVCSPISSACCSTSCQLIQKSEKLVCKRPTECAMASYCNGNSSDCPSPQLLPDGLLCNGGRKTCLNGTCSASICETKGLVECQCINDKEHLCKLCCKDSNITNCECLPASHYGIHHVNGDILHRNTGDPCNNFNGFCDNKVCISDTDDSIRIRMKEIFSGRSIEDLGVWFQNFWYYILMAVFLIVFTGAVYRATYLKIRHFDIETEAERYGKLLAICQGVQAHIQYFEDQIESITKQFNDKILTQEKPRPEIAISRLHLLFPDVSLTDISRVVHSSSSEEFAVKMLLIRGHSMKKYSLRKGNRQSTSNLDKGRLRRRIKGNFDQGVTLVEV